MVGVFAAATARLTPEFLESFDPEKLASKFVRVEKEFGVKFTKSKSTFNIVGHWEAVRNAHRSLLKLKFNEKYAEKYSKKREKCKDKPRRVTEAPPMETDSKDNCNEIESHSSDSVLPLLRGKGNPKRGRHAPKESMYTSVPEPVFFLQYQDKTFADADSLDINSVLEDFEKSQLAKKVTKEELKKILEKNKDQMGKPLEKGIPKGAIIPIPKRTEQECDSFAVNSTAQTSNSSEVYENSDQSFINSYSYLKAEHMTQSPIMSSAESSNLLNSALITTYTVNARMSTYNMEMISNSNQENGDSAAAVGQINVEDFYNHPADDNDRLPVVSGVFANDQFSAQEQVQLPDSETDSFCGMFENYDPQSVLNPIPSSEKSLNGSEGAVTSMQPVDVKSAVCDSDIPGQSEPGDVSMKADSVPCIRAEINSNFSSSPVTNDHIQFDTNRVKIGMNGYDEIDDEATFQEFTEIPANSTDLPVLQSNSSVADFVNISMTANAQPNPAFSHVSAVTESGTNTNNAMISISSTVQTSPEDLISMKTQMDLIETKQVSMATDINSAPYPSADQIQTDCPQSASETNVTVGKTVEAGNNLGLNRLPYAEMTEAKGVVTQEKSLESQNITTDKITECQKRALVQPDTRDGSVAYTEETESTETTTDNFDDNEKDAKDQHIDRKIKKTEEIILEMDGTSTCVEAPDVADKDRTKTIIRNEGEQDEVKRGNVVSPLKIKKSRLSSNKVKAKASEKTEKVKKKRGRKPKIAGSGKEPEHGSHDSKDNTSEENADGSTRKSKKCKDLETPEQAVLESENSTKLKVKEKAKRKTKQKEEKSVEDIKEKQIYKCTECDYQGCRKKRLTEHMGRVHGLLSNGTQPEDPMFTCDECEKTFVFEKDLNRHKKIVHHGQVFVCLICHKNYKSKYVFDRHTATHEDGYIQPKFRCQICEREFTTKFSLSSHIKSEHLGMKKTYSCPTCGKTFSQIRSYRQHANVHAGIRPYTCEVCGKSFTYDKSLKEHRYMHDTVRRFQCTVCQKAFRQQTCLLIHMKTHKEKKDHICSVCGREFTQKQSLLRHERIHTGDKPYSCKICFKSFGDYAVIRKHVMMAHKKSKDSWKDDIFTEEKKRSSHYIDGGPGYVPRDSYAKLHQKNQAAAMPSATLGGQVMIAPLGQEPQMINGPSQQSFGHSLEGINKRGQSENDVSVSSQGDLNTIQNIYQAFPETLDFSVMETLKPKQQDNFTPVVNVPVNYSLIQSVEGDAFNSIGPQQPNLNIKAYPYSLTISPLVKGGDANSDAYAAQFLNSPVTASTVSVEASSVSLTGAQDQMINSSTSNVSVVVSDSTASSSAITMATTNNGWMYPGYPAAYYSPASFSQYQSSPDT